MVTVDEAIIARLEKGGKHFEVLVDADLAYELKEGKTVSLSRMLAANIVFSDARKAVKASPADIESAFGTQDTEKVAEFIVRHGDVQLTTDFRRRKMEERRRQIAGLISKTAMNPQTKLPHPADRILRAMELAKVSIDPFRQAEQQLPDVIKALKPVIPISVEEIEIEVEIPAQYSGRAYSAVHEYTVRKEQWLGNGNLYAKIAVPAGMRESAFRRLNVLTDGTAKITEGMK